MIIFFWQGLGFLVAVIAFGCSLIANLMADAMGGEGYFDHHKWPLGISLLVSGVICWYLGDYLRMRPGRVLIDKQTGREVVFRKKHTLFFVPMHWWGAILAGCALVAFAAEFVH